MVKRTTLMFLRSPLKNFRNVALIVFLFLFQGLAYGQGNVLDGVSATGPGNFEGASLAADGWSVVNFGSNKHYWVQGTSGIVTSGTKGAYISSNATGTNNTYANNAARYSHLYRDVTFPAGASSITLTFKWRCVGEATNFDYCRVYISGNGVFNTPVVTAAPTGTQLGGTFYQQATTQTATITLAPGTYNGTSRRLFFTWTNDNSTIGTPAIAIDQVDINAVIPPPCSTTPTPGTTAATATTGCAPYNTTLSLTGATAPGGGVVYQWQSGLTAAGPWNNLGTATTQAATIFVGTYFRCTLTCTNTGQFASSTPILCNTSPAHTVASMPFTESFEAWQNFCANSDVPGTYWVNNPATGDLSWRRDDQGATAGWTYNGGAYTPAFTVGAHSARFDSYSASTGQGSLDLIIDLSPAGTKNISFDYINVDGTDNLKLQLSTDGGTTFTNLGTYNTQAAWATKTATTTATANPAILRFLATTDFGYSDIGVDNVNVVPPCTPPAITSVTVTQPTTCGGTGSLVINGTSLSGNYTVTYTGPSGTVTTGSIAAVANTVTVTGLALGNYTNISIKQVAATCSSNVLAGPYTISNPTAPAITLLTPTNPATCGGTGSIAITGTGLTGNYTVTYTGPSGTVTTGAIAAVANVVTVTGLVAGNYSNFKITSVTTTCVSNTLAGPVTLSDPAPPGISSVVPTGTLTCGGNSGSFTVNASTTLSGNYTVTYTGPSGTVTTGAIAAVGNSVTVTGLSAGNYTNISIRSVTTTCNSTVFAGPVTIVDPAPPAIGGVVPAGTTTCGGNDGSFTVNASTTLSGNYTVTYTGPSGTVTTGAIAAVGNSVTVTGLAAGNYTNISISSVTTNCLSAAFAGPVTITDPTPPNITSNSSLPPSTCGGTDGSITINGTSLTGNYTATYTSSVAGTVTTGPIAASGNAVVITGLGAATYTNISIKSSTTLCVSNVMAGPIVLNDPTPPVVTNTGTFDPTTCGGSDGTLTVFGTSLAGNYSVTYTSSAAGTVTTAPIAAVASAVTVTGLPAATYTNISIKFVATGCISNILPGPIVINDPAAPSISLITKTDPITCGGNEGSIIIHVDSATVPLNGSCDVAYTNTAGPQLVTLPAVNGIITISNQFQDNYTNFTVKANWYNCTSTNYAGPVVLTDPSKPNISNITSTGPTSCGGAQGTITLVVDSATVPLNGACTVFYTDINGAQTLSLPAVNGLITITGLPQGTYTNFSVYATWYNCTSAVVAGPVNLSDPNPPVITNTGSSDPTTCFGNEGTITLQGLIASTTYLVNYDSATYAVSRTVSANGFGDVVITGLIAGTYSNIRVTLNSCVSNIVGPITLSDPPNPVITAFSNSPVCEGQTVNFSSIVTLNGNPALGNSYAWTGPGFVGVINQANPSIANAPATATGTYTVTTTIANCVSAPFTLPVTVYDAPPVPILASNSPVCSGNDLHLDVTNPTANFIYVWNGPAFATPDTTTNAVVTNAQVPATGTYSVSVTSAMGCGLLVPSTISVVVNQTPQPPVTTGAIYCQGDTALALVATPTGNPNDVLQWYTQPNGGTGTTTPPIPSTTTDGVFTWYVTQTSAQNCESATRTPQEVTIKTKPNVPISSAPHVVYCQFDSTAVALMATGDSLKWYTQAVGGNDTDVAPIPPTTTPGNYTWYVTQTIMGCESSRLPIIVTIIPKPQPPVTQPIRYCQYDNADPLSAVGLLLKWYTQPIGGNYTTTAPIPSTQVPGVTTWYVSQTVNGCESDRQPIEVTVFYLPTAQIATSKDELCQYDTLLVSYIGNGTSTANYQWTWPAGANVKSGAQAGPYVVAMNNIGDHQFALVVSENGCSSGTVTHDVHVKQTPQLEIKLRNSLVCQDEDAIMDISYLDMQAQYYYWNFGTGHISDGSTSINSEHAPGPYHIHWDEPGNYTVKLGVVATNGCYSSTVEVPVVIRPRPEAKIQVAGNINDICAGDSVMLSASQNNSNYTYQWSPVQFFRNSDNNAVVYAYLDMSSTVNLQVTNEFGCIAKDSLSFAPKSCCEILLPSAFSPNGDGKNDLFRIINPGRHKLQSLQVFNRYGQEVFSSSNERQGWDGSHFGTAQEMGTYFYLIHFICNGKETTQKGEVTLVR